MFIFDSSVNGLINVPEINVFILENFELKQIAIVTNLSYFEKPAPHILYIYIRNPW